MIFLIDYYNLLKMKQVTLLVFADKNVKIQMSCVYYALICITYLSKVFSLPAG